MNLPTALLLLLACCSCTCSTATAHIVLTSEFFNGRIQSFDTATKIQTNFAMVGGNPGLSGLAYNPATNTVYASALNHGGVYRFNAQTGSLLGFNALGPFGPGGLAVSPTGQLFITDFTSNNVRVYDATLSTLQQTIVVNNPIGRTSGVGFLNNGDALITTPGGGVYRFNGNVVTAFSANPAASAATAQVAADSQGNIFIGHGTGFANSVLRFDGNGNLLGAIDITPAMLNSHGRGSSPGTSPGGVTFDADGNLIVAALGQSNPNDGESSPGAADGERGGLFKFDVNGNLLDTFTVGSRAYSGVVFITAVPEPNSFTLLTIMVSFAAVYQRRRTKGSNVELSSP